MNMKNRFVGLVILDGYGLAPESESNSVTLANKPYMDHLLKTYPNSTLRTSGEFVGLPEGQMGNSEVGHLNLGAGRVVYQSLSRINLSINDASFFSNEAFLKAFEHVKKHNSKLHIMGLVSDGGVHSHLNHLKALTRLCKSYDLCHKTYLHAFMDGRDTSQTGGYEYLKELIKVGAKVATVSGRYYAMDRDNNWDRIQKAYDAMVLGEGEYFENPLEGIQKAYDEDLSDEFIVPFVSNKKGLIEDNDAVIFANYRPDRAIRIATAISNPKETKFFHTDGKKDFKLSKELKNINFVSMMHYHEKVKGDLAFPFVPLNNIYGEVIQDNNLKQLRIAETEKYAHVTFFFDGGREIELKGEKRILIESPKVPTYDLMPEMGAYEIRDEAVKAIKSKEFDTMVLNFANPDMVGHTGNIEATTKAVEVVDECLKDVVEAIESVGGVAIVIADHGNAEQMRAEDGTPHTAHTTNLVPVIVTDTNYTVNQGSLCDVAPTMLDLLNIEKPKEMSGVSLVKPK